MSGHLHAGSELLSSPSSEDGRCGWCRQQLDCRELRVPEPKLAYWVERRGARRQVVQHREAAGCEQPDDELAVLLRAQLLRRVEEDEIERRLRRQQLAPVSGEHVNVPVVPEELGDRSGALVVQLNREDRHAGRQTGREPGGTDAAAGPDLCNPPAAARAREHVEQLTHLPDARAHEALLLREGERPLDGRRQIHGRPRLIGVPAPLPLPPHWNPGLVGEVWRVDYAGRSADAARWREAHTLQPAAQDRFRVALVLVDVQNTFCTPGFELFVAGRSGQGALDDSLRLCEFVYRNLGSITHVFPTLDAHGALQIFHPVLLVDKAGNHPEPFTIVSADDVAAGRWRMNQAAAGGLGLDPAYADEHLRYYTRTLEQGGKYDLTIWPFHAMRGGIGYALVSAVEEAIFFHSIARYAPVDYQPKGDNPLTEHYSMLGPEVEEDQEGEPLGRRNQPLIEELLRYDAVVIAGQAKSHCVAWTIQDLLDDPTVRGRRLEEKVYLLEDCTSSVVVPGVVDYTAEADAAFARFAGSGAHLVRSTEPISDWPGVIGETLTET